MKLSGRRAQMIALFTVLLFVFGIFAAGCSSKETGGEKTGETIKIGVNYELSGQVATYGTSCKNGVMLAFEEINKNGGVLGKQIEPLVQDNKSVLEESQNVAAKLISEGIVAMIGPATTGNVLAEEPLLTEAKIPLLATAATAPTVTYNEETKKLRDFVFRVCIIDPDQSLVMSDFITDELKLKTGAIIVDAGNDYSEGLGKTFKEFFTARGGKIVAEEGFLSTDTAYKAQLTRINSKKPDFIYVPAYYNQVGLIIKQARELGIDVPFMGADGWDSPELVNIAKADSLTNTYFTNHYTNQDPSEKVQNFVKAYQAKHKTVPDAFAALGYDAGYLMAAAVAQAGSADPVKIQQAMAGIKDFEGVTGKLTFDDKHNPVKEISLIKMVEGKQELLKKAYPKK